MQAIHDTRRPLIRLITKVANPAHTKKKTWPSSAHSPKTAILSEGEPRNTHSAAPLPPRTPVHAVPRAALSGTHSPNRPGAPSPRALTRKIAPPIFLFSTRRRQGPRLPMLFPFAMGVPEGTLEKKNPVHVERYA